MQNHNPSKDTSLVKKSIPEDLSNQKFRKTSTNLNMQQEMVSNDGKLTANVMQVNQQQEEVLHDEVFTCSSACRYPDGSIRLRNPNIERMERDILYYLMLDSTSSEMFGDVKTSMVNVLHLQFVCFGDTLKSLERFAYSVMEEIGIQLPCGTALRDISQAPHRYSMYKVGPVLAISHGVGMPSVGILLHEMIKLMYHARVREPVFFITSSCGGVGLEAGTVVVSDGVVDGMMRSDMEIAVLGNVVRRPAKLDKSLARELQALADAEDPYETVVGKTMCTHDFYEGQGRTDGAFCDFTEGDKAKYLQGLRRIGVVNMDMEALAFAAITHHAGIRAAVICVTLLDRLKEDQIHTPREVVEEWQERPAKLVCRFIKWSLQKGDMSLEGQGPLVSQTV